MATVSTAEIESRRRLVPRESPLFSRERQQRQVAAFIRDIVSEHASRWSVSI
jgi:hypothetical protein